MSDRARNRSHRGSTDDWLTPEWIVRDLGPFDLDPCCPPRMPWRTARRMYRLGRQDGLALPWAGRVWLNPPYSNVLPWVERFAECRGTALVPAKSLDTRWGQLLLQAADLVLLYRGRIKFAAPDGSESAGAWGPSLFAARGRRDVAALSRFAGGGGPGGAPRGVLVMRVP